MFSRNFTLPIVGGAKRRGRGKRRGPLAAFAVPLLAGACQREPEPFVCPEVEEGELVVSELRGPNGSGDTFGQWIELFNGSGADLDLYGLRVIVTPGDGGPRIVLRVRFEPVEVPVGEYVVLGLPGEVTPPDFVDYVYDNDGTTNMPSSALVDVEACGVVIDHTSYKMLPGLGTLAFDGALPPDPEANDDQSRWCNDANPLPDGAPQTGIGLPGTPGEGNHPCR